MPSFANRLSDSLFSPRPLGFARKCLGIMVVSLGLIGGGIAAEQVENDFGKAIQLAPFVVKGSPLSVYIHARTKSDRRYGEKFADEVVEIAYETLGGSTGKGLVIVGAKGEPHPIHLFRHFIVMVRAGQLHPDMAAVAGELEAQLKKLQEKFKVQDDPGKPTGITFDAFLPALPIPLEGPAAKLYRLAWAEGFNDTRVEQMLRSLTRADLDRDELIRYDWVFYVPPHSATAPVLKDMMNKAMTAEKMGLVKRAAIRSAVFVFRPVITKAVESMRKAFLFATILRAESKYDEGDIDALTQAYLREMKPDLKPGNGDEHRRALAAIEKQKIANAEYAKDPFVKPTRLATYDPAAYAQGEGEYTSEPPKATHWFKREGDSFQWNYKNHPPRNFYPAGDGLLVNEDGSMTSRFLADANGGVTGIEERWVRRRQVIPRQISSK